MAEMRSLEEYVRGTEGDDEKALVGALRRAAAEARSGGFERVQLEVRVTPTGEPSRQEATWSCKVEDDPRAVADRALELLTDSPGETFAGELRINFRAPGDSRAHFGSYTRKIRPVALNAPGGGDDGDGATVDVKALSAVVGLVERLARVAGDAVEKNVALMGGSATMMNGASTLMVNHARATGRVVEAPAKPGGVPVIHDLLRGVLKVGEAAAGSDSKVGKAAAAAGAALDVGAPAPDPDGTTGGAVPTLTREGGDGAADFAGDPAPEGAITEAAAEAWARANPDKARAMAMRLMSEGM